MIDTPRQLVLRHQTAVVAIASLQRQHHGALLAMIQYQEMTAGDMLHHFREVKTDLDERYVLAVFASIEAAVKIDARWRLRKGKRSCKVARAFQNLANNTTWERLRLKDLLQCWQGVVGSGRQFSELIRISHRRHWLAHGKYFQDKSGVGELEPADVLYWWQQAEAAARAVAPDFPRDDRGI